MDHVDESTYRARLVLIKSMRSAFQRFLKNGARPSDITFCAGFTAAELADGLFEDGDPLMESLKMGMQHALSNSDDSGAEVGDALEDSTVH